MAIHAIKNATAISVRRAELIENRYSILGSAGKGSRSRAFNGMFLKKSGGFRDRPVMAISVMADADAWLEFDFLVVRLGTVVMRHFFPFGVSAVSSASQQ
jgi:hypothetical protein